MGILLFFKKLLGLEPEDEVLQAAMPGYGMERFQIEPNLGTNDLMDDEATRIPSMEKSPNEAKKVNSGTSKKSKPKKKSPTIATYNLIILDESGSMRSVREEVVSGCNETLQSIRDSASKMRDIKQYISIFCFDTSRSRYIFQNMPIETIREVTMADYYPNAYTPLYDAIGFTVTELCELIDNNKSIGVVTIITDGHENASRQWDYHMVVDLIDQMKRRGWVFTFIGADIDVEATAAELGINNCLKFEKTKEGMAQMFEEKNRSDLRYNNKRNYMEKLRSLGRVKEEECMEVYDFMNNNYFLSEDRISPDEVHQLNDDEIYVFGSNINGLHDSGDSLYALEHFGAINGQAEGIQGQSYAIPTIGNSFDDLKAAIERFNEYVVLHPEKKFILSTIGCTTSKYTVKEMAQIFQQAYSFGNVFIPREFLNYLE